MTDREQTKFERADLKPETITFQCPVCGYGGSEDLTEGPDAVFRVPDESRFIRCDGCDTLIDIGWAGWSVHEVPARAANEHSSTPSTDRTDVST